jgi:hypothetical protein
MNAVMQLILFLILVVGPLATVMGQVRTGHNSVKGTIVDADSSLPLALVNVFLQGTTRGTTSQNDGGYQLDNLADGEYSLVFSLVGYERHIEELSLKGSTQTRLNVRLIQRTIGVSQVEVIGSLARWQKMFDTFAKEFLGASEFARQCRFGNPNVIRVSFDSSAGYLRASADSIIILENNALGYRVFASIDSFTYSPSSGWITMRCFPRYEEMISSDRGQLDEWKANRLAAYRQSAAFFFRSLIRGTLREEHFNVTAGLTGALLTGPGFPLTPRSVVVRASPDSSLFEVSFQNKSLRVEWQETVGIADDGSFLQTLKNILPWNWKHTIPRPTIMTTVVIPRQEWILCDAYGYLVTPLSVIFRGYWSSLRLADQLPFDYDPEKKGN